MGKAHVFERYEGRVGNFMLEKMDSNGTIKAGCHTVAYDEVELIAKQLKLIA
jgi:hypothetical protein